MASYLGLGGQEQKLQQLVLTTVLMFLLLAFTMFIVLRMTRT